jgi:hypothetical protein
MEDSGPSDTELDARGYGQAPPGYRTQSEDTSYAAERLMFDRLRGLGSVETARWIDSACRMMDELLLAGLRRQFPGAGAEELELRAAVQKYGAELVERLTGRTPPPRP